MNLSDVITHQRKHGFIEAEKVLTLPLLVESLDRIDCRMLTITRTLSLSGMAFKPKATDDQIRESYLRTRSVWATGRELGMCGQSVHERVKKLDLVESTRITDEDIAKIKAVYFEGFERGDGKLRALCSALGRRVTTVSREARRLGLTNACRKGGDSNRAACKVRTAFQWMRLEHPRGMLGKKHTQKTKDAVSKAGKGRMVPRERTLRAMKTKLKKYGTLANPRKGVSWKQGWRTVGGVTFFARSKWEANYARFLQWLKTRGSILEWEHESEVFFFEIEAGNMSYMPDFKVTLKSGIIEYREVKGWMDERSIEKIRLMGEVHPTLKLRLIRGDWFSRNARRLQRIIEEWEPQ